MVYFSGCPGAKKTEFLTSVLDALSTDMVHAVTDPASAGRYDGQKWTFYFVVLDAHQCVYYSPKRHKNMILDNGWAIFS